MPIQDPNTPPRDTTPSESILTSEKEIHNRQDHADTSHLEHKHTNQTQQTDLSKDDDLEKVETWDIDPANRRALKGDDGDGKIDWTKKQIVATISLAMIYTGMLSRNLILLHYLPSKPFDFRFNKDRKSSPEAPIDVFTNPEIVSSQLTCFLRLSNPPLLRRRIPRLHRSLHRSG